eukprot:4209322-Prymnesium_polylepis.2
MRCACERPQFESQRRYNRPPRIPPRRSRASRLPNGTLCGSPEAALRKSRGCPPATRRASRSQAGGSLRTHSNRS